MVTSKDAKRMARAGGLIMMVGFIAYMVEGVIGNITRSPNFLVFSVILVGSLIGIAGMIMDRAARKSNPQDTPQESEADIQTLFGSNR
jgi:UDP-N-acetylmuramyl pentapeptide phosphotransferase/UDP-N-acetylglucosamine-1-phosphate transferase